MIDKAKAYVHNAINKYPELTDDIMEFFELFLTEIQDSETSIINEYNLMIGDIDNLIEDHLNKGKN